MIHDAHAASRPDASSGTTGRRHPLRDILLACVLVLLLSQGLIGALSLSALKHQVSDNTAERVELLARQSAGQIQTGMRLGKPLAQYFGLSRLLDALGRRVPDLLGASVVLSDGRVLASVGDPPPSSDLLRALASPRAGMKKRVVQRRSGAAYRADATGVTVAVPLVQGRGLVAGALLLRVHAQDLRQSGLLSDNLKVLGLITACATLVLALLFRFAVPRYRLAVAGKARLALPLVVLLLAQGLYAAYTVQTFRETWLAVTRDNTQVLGRGLQGDLDRVLAYGISPAHLRGVERPMARLAAAFPVIGELRLVDAGGRLLNRADARGALPAAGAPRASPDLTLTFPLASRPGGPAAASLRIILDAAAIGAGVRARILDAATVAAVALVAAMELILLLTVLMDRAFAARARTPSGEPVGLDDASRVGAIVRPVMFGFLFALALPLSFLPIHARALLHDTGAGGRGVDFLMALPIAAEMACGLLTALLAGRLVDRRGWLFPVLAGLLVSAAGSGACALAGSLPTFILARGLVGLGYGLAWMGLQGFVVVRSPAAYRARNMAMAVAGLFAGHLSGAAVGAMLVEQLGAAAVFATGAALLILPAIGVATLMWPYRHFPAGAAASGAAAPVVRSWTALRRLLATRDFGMLLLGCVIPFSIAQVGLLTYALPLYLEAYGGTTASVGRILMLYGLCVIYAGPAMARMADRSARRKNWIVGGGLIGSAGLLGLYFVHGIAPVAVAVVLLAFASCLAGGAQTAYMLGLEHVQSYGAGAATSVMRAADKFGQMLGPLAVGGLFASTGISAGLAATGALYLLATLAFMAFAPALSGRPATEARAP